MIEYIECRNSSRELIGIIDIFQSVIWRTEYDGAGDFEIYVPFSQNYFKWLSVDNCVTRYDRNEIGIIESISITYSAEEGRMIKAAGRFALCILERRLWADIVIAKNRCIINIISDNTKAEEACHRVIQETIISPDWENRKIDFVIIGKTNNLTATISETQSTYRNVLTLTQTILKNVSYGQRMNFNRITRNIEYEVYEGIDRTESLTFSQDYDNLLSFEYSYDATTYKTGFLIAGDGEGKDRFYAYYNRDTSKMGIQRREYCYESNYSSTYNDKNGQEQVYSNEVYAAILTNDCKSKFSEHSSQVNIRGTVDLSLLTFNRDYSVGDLVTIKDIETGINTKARIWGVTETQDENGYTVEADFEENE